MKVNEEKNLPRFLDKQTYLLNENRMTICASCGKEHGMVIEDMETGECTPIDWCKECIFTKGYIYKEPEPIDFDKVEDWAAKLEEMQKKIIGDMSGMDKCEG